VLLHEAMLHVRLRQPDKEWLMYEEPSYRLIPALLQERLSRLWDAHVRATPCVPPTAPATRKKEAVLCYASQLRALRQTVDGGYADAFTAERYWRLDDVPHIGNANPPYASPA
jgi:hypothetical protein